MDAKWLRGLDPMGVIGFVKEDMDGGPPVALKNGGAPQWAAGVPNTKLVCAIVEGPARPDVVLAVVKVLMAGWLAWAPEPSLPTHAIIVHAGAFVSGKTPDPSAFVPLWWQPIFLPVIVGEKPDLRAKAGDVVCRHIHRRGVDKPENGSGSGPNPNPILICYLADPTLSSPHRFDLTQSNPIRSFTTS
jgi:hypothetical protein